MPRISAKKTTAVAVAGGVIALLGWALGGGVGVPVALGVAVAGGLLVADLLRVAQRRTEAAVGRLHNDVRVLRDLRGSQERGARRDDVFNAEKRLRESIERSFAQTEALLNLYQVVPTGVAMPASRGWAASPDILLHLVSLVGQTRPATVVDLGSGATTIWMGTAMRHYGVDGRIISIDHDEKFAAITRESVLAHGLAKFVDVRHAPLVEMDLAGERWPWYDQAAFADVERVDLLVVDGPPGVLRDHARYPALPVLAARLAPHARVVVDDYARSDETEMVRRWQSEFPGWTLRELRHEKGTAVLRREPGQ